MSVEIPEVIQTGFKVPHKVQSISQFKGTAIFERTVSQFEGTATGTKVISQFKGTAMRSSKY